MKGTEDCFLPRGRKASSPEDSATANLAKIWESARTLFRKGWRNRIPATLSGKDASAGTEEAVTPRCPSIRNGCGCFQAAYSKSSLVVAKLDIILEKNIIFAGQPKRFAMNRQLTTILTLGILASMAIGCTGHKVNADGNVVEEYSAEVVSDGTASSQSFILRNNSHV